jgi:hypothetical protein
MSIDRERTPVANKVLIGNKVTTEDNGPELWDERRLANKGDESIPSTNTAVEAIVLPSLAMTVNSLCRKMSRVSI